MSAHEKRARFSSLRPTDQIIAIELMTNGALDLRDIAARTGLSWNNARKRWSEIREKLDVRSQKELILEYLCAVVGCGCSKDNAM